MRKGRGEAGAGGELLHPTPLPGEFPAKIQPGGLSESVMHQSSRATQKTFSECFDSEALIICQAAALSKC